MAGRLAVVVGIGTNVVAAPGGHAVPLRASLVGAGHRMISAEELFAALSDAGSEFRGIWDNGRGFGEIRRRWLERAAGLGERSPSRYRRGDRSQGTFRHHRRLPAA